jgi:hypothetical protein
MTNFENRYDIVTELRKKINQLTKSNNGRVRVGVVYKTMADFFNENPQMNDALLRAGIDLIIDKATNHLKYVEVRGEYPQSPMTITPYYVIDPDKIGNKCKKCGSTDTIVYTSAYDGTFVDCEECGYESRIGA